MEVPSGAWQRTMPTLFLLLVVKMDACVFLISPMESLPSFVLLISRRVCTCARNNFKQKSNGRPSSNELTPKLIHSIARILSLAWSQDDTIMITGSANSSIYKWNVELGRVQSRMTVDRVSGEDTLVWAVKFLTNGNIVSGDSLGHVKFWDGETTTMIQSFNSHGADVLCLAAARVSTIQQLERILLYVYFRFITDCIFMIHDCMINRTATLYFLPEWTANATSTNLWISQHLERMERTDRSTERLRWSPSGSWLARDDSTRTTFEHWRWMIPGMSILLSLVEWMFPW